MFKSIRTFCDHKKSITAITNILIKTEESVTRKLREKKIIDYENKLKLKIVTNFV